ASRTPDEQARALRHLDPTTSARDLREGAGRLRPMLAALDARTWQRPSPVPGRSVGEGVLSLWYDTFVHGDDIRAALGIPSERGPGLAAAVEWLRLSLGRRRWGPARLVLDGLGEFPIGDGGPTLRGDPVCFVLVASGRADPAEFGVDERVNIYR
ncbi:MAG TPA: maleylpyruvate isomerase N-terminal domain-containing protein, partial [Micromonosporaceae bacterium]